MVTNRKFSTYKTVCSIGKKNKPGKFGGKTKKLFWIFYEHFLGVLYFNVFVYALSAFSALFADFLRQIARYLSHQTDKYPLRNHLKSKDKKIKTVSYQMISSV